MPAAPSKDPLFSAAVLKLSTAQKGLADTPGFRVVYAGVIRELGVTDSQVEAYIAEHRDHLLAHIRRDKKS